MGVRRAAGTLIGQSTAAVALVWTIAGLSRGMADRAAEAGTGQLAWIAGAFRPDAGSAVLTRAEHPFAVAVWLVASVVSGVWLGSTLPHWRRWAPAVIWPALLMIAVGADAGAWCVWAPVARAAGRFEPYWGPSAGQWWSAARVALAAGLIATMALPAGWGVRAAADWQRRRRWRARRTRLRLERGGL